MDQNTVTPEVEVTSSDDGGAARVWTMTLPAPVCDPALLKDSAEMFKAMGHDIRLAALACMQTGEKTVGELGAFLNLRQPAVSQILSVLRNSGLVVTRRDGKNIYYGLASEDLLPLITLATRIRL